MKRRSLALLYGVAMMSFPALPASAEVAVRFVEPQHYTDAGDYGIRAQRNLESLARHLQTLGKCLPADQSLDIRVTDIDLAGRHNGVLRLRR